MYFCTNVILFKKYTKIINKLHQIQYDRCKVIYYNQAFTMIKKYVFGNRIKQCTGTFITI